MPNSSRCSHGYSYRGDLIPESPVGLPTIYTDDASNNDMSSNVPIMLSEHVDLDDGTFSKQCSTHGCSLRDISVHSFSPASSSTAYDVARLKTHQLATNIDLFLVLVI